MVAVLRAGDTAMMQSTQEATMADRVTLKRGTWNPTRQTWDRPFSTVVATAIPADIVTESQSNDPFLHDRAVAAGINPTLYRRITMRYRTGFQGGDRLYKEPASFVLTPSVTTAGATINVRVGNQTTVGLTAQSTPAQMQTALQALSTVGAGGATVTGTVGGPYYISLDKSLGVPYVVVTGTAVPSASQPPLLYTSPVYSVKNYATDESQPVLLLVDCQVVVDAVD